MTRAFSQTMLSLDLPMLIVTAAADGEQSGCLLAFATQTSIEPQRFLVCISEANHTHGVAAKASALAVHLVPEGRLDLAEHFGTQSDDDVPDKFAEIDWHAAQCGAPVLVDCPTWFAGPVLDRRALGDHTGHLIDPVEGEFNGARTLGFLDARDMHPGHTP